MTLSSTPNSKRSYQPCSSRTPTDMVRHLNGWAVKSSMARRVIFARSASFRPSSGTSTAPIFNAGFSKGVTRPIFGARCRTINYCIPQMCTRRCHMWGSFVLRQPRSMDNKFQFSLMSPLNLRIIRTRTTRASLRGSVPLVSRTSAGHGRTGDSSETECVEYGISGSQRRSNHSG